MMIINPVKHNCVTDDIVHRIESAIVNHRLKPGERLQTERELQDTMRASRGAVREALSILRQKGLIETRRGGKGGAYVKKIGVEHVSEGLAFLIKYRGVDLQELAEFRINLEGLAAGLAAERATSQDMAAMKSILDDMDRRMGKGEESLLEFYAIEMEMHQLLAEMSGNTLVEWSLKTIHLNLAACTELYLWDKNGPENHRRDWDEVAEAIQRQKGIKARSLIESHILRSNRVLAEGARRLGLIGGELGGVMFKEPSLDFPAGNVLRGDLREAGS